MKETKIDHLKFHTGTQGTAEHEQFINDCNEKDIEIIGFWVTYHDRPNAHEPHYLHYVIKNQKIMEEKKQSSIEWLFHKMYENRGMITVHEFEQVKAMHRKEIEDTFFEGAYGGDIISAEQYYNETFGGNNE